MRIQGNGEELLEQLIKNFDNCPLSLEDKMELLGLLGYIKDDPVINSKSFEIIMLINGFKILWGPSTYRLMLMASDGGGYAGVFFNDGVSRKFVVNEPTPAKTYSAIISWIKMFIFNQPLPEYQK